MKKYFLLLSISILSLFACQNTLIVNDMIDYVDLDTITIRPSNNETVYQATESRLVDLTHTKLSVSFDWEKTHLLGDAELTLTPYYYALDTIEIDAKGFDLSEVSQLNELGERRNLSYEYDQKVIRIALDSSIEKGDTIQLKIRYTAKPNELESGGSEAITNDIGLYFINPNGEDVNKPRQIWTQGETEASSCWFPTIDVPNEKMTQEVIITVDSNFKTLSNGELLYQIENSNGTRTDYWEQKLPHAPYLCMMAIGEFAIVHDEWKSKPVNYYVEKAYKPYAREIFPHTLEMLSFYSSILKYPYPWFKYDQVVVRDYVSGAMENTSAVIFGEFMQGNSRYLMDNNGEDIVAHEMFHHWFGDLVTCESWSNLPLNEAFATYGEYLWMEHKYGKDAADYHLYKDELAYKQEARIERKKLIRFEYEDKEDMFDAHSYQKGGRVLHMLRSEIGDSAFFDGLAHYLKKHEYKSAEIHDMRLAFEEICGRDLNWFFEQWFLKAGHPVVETSFEYDSSNRVISLKVEQTQKGKDIPEVFNLNTTVEIKTTETTYRVPLSMNRRKQTFKIKSDSKPAYVQIDPDNILLLERTDAYSLAVASELYHPNNDFLDRYKAVDIASNQSDEMAFTILEEALKDRFWRVKSKAIAGGEKMALLNGKIKEQLIQLSKDEKSDVRAEAIEALAFYYENPTDTNIVKAALSDSSYLVVSAAIESLYFLDEAAALREAQVLTDLNSSDVLSSIAYIYAEDGRPSHYPFFKSTLSKLDSYERYDFINSYGEFITQQKDSEILNSSIDDLSEIALNDNKWWIRMSAVSAMINVKDNLSAEQSALDEKVSRHLKDIQKQEGEETIKKMIGMALR